MWPKFLPDKGAPLAENTIDATLLVHSSTLITNEDNEVPL